MRNKINRIILNGTQHFICRSDDAGGRAAKTAPFGLQVRILLKIDVIKRFYRQKIDIKMPFYPLKNVNPY